MRISMKLQIDKSKKLPLYQQIVEQIRAQITSGEIPEGYQFPSERQLAEALGVSFAAVSKWERGGSLIKIPHQSHADFCSTDTAGGLDNKKRRYAPRGGVAYRLFLWGFPKGATPPFGTRLCEAKCSVLYALSALP